MSTLDVDDAHRDADGELVVDAYAAAVGLDDERAIATVVPDGQQDAAAVHALLAHLDDQFQVVRDAARPDGAAYHVFPGGDRDA